MMMLSYVESLIFGNIPFSVQAEEVVETTVKQYPNKRHVEIQNKPCKLTFFRFWLRFLHLLYDIEVMWRATIN